MSSHHKIQHSIIKRVAYIYQIFAKLFESLQGLQIVPMQCLQDNLKVSENLCKIGSFFLEEKC